jgi:1,4-alpha-glucan branching enzyme
LTGANVNLVFLNEAKNLCAYHRWYEGGAGDDVFVAVNFAGTWAENITVAFPYEGVWKLRLNSDWSGYSKDFGSDATDVRAEKKEEGYLATLKIPPYTALIYSQDPAKPENGK